jgi:hypothetical protein
MTHGMNPFTTSVYMSEDGRWCSYDGTPKQARPNIPGSKLMNLEVPPASELTSEVISVYGRPTTFYYKHGQRDMLMSRLKRFITNG